MLDMPIMRANVPSKRGSHSDDDRAKYNDEQKCSISIVESFYVPWCL